MGGWWLVDGGWWLVVGEPFQPTTTICNISDPSISPEGIPCPPCLLHNRERICNLCHSQGLSSILSARCAGGAAQVRFASRGRLRPRPRKPRRPCSIWERGQDTRTLRPASAGLRGVRSDVSPARPQRPERAPAGRPGRRLRRHDERSGARCTSDLRLLRSFLPASKESRRRRNCGLI